MISSRDSALANSTPASPACSSAVNKHASWALGILLVINLLNYLDRQVLFALLPLIKAEFGSTDTQLGALASAFMLVYMCAAPPIGYLADRTSRKGWISFGVAFWSLATVFSGLARRYGQPFAAPAADPRPPRPRRGGCASPSASARTAPSCSARSRWRR